MARLRFEAPDLQRFPCLRLARAALQAGGSAPNVLNAANEVAVQAFLEGRLPYTGIARVIERTLDAAERGAVGRGDDLGTILAIDSWARAKAGDMVNA